VNNVTVLLDTHVWIWWLTPESDLRANERAALDRLGGEGGLGISAISLWEAQMLHRKGRLHLPIPFRDWIEQAADERMLTIAPLDVAVVTELDQLPERFHGDPADRLIVATAKSLRLPLATHDTTIRRARLVEIWQS
jgi:PIN domain nuclease of toxin-antitoxin system